MPNASPTAASVGSDLNGLAVQVALRCFLVNREWFQDACRQLNERLKPIKEANPKDSWDQWIHKAYMDRISLSAAGFGLLPYQPVDFTKGIGAELFGYCVYGTACCEVEVDCLTGDHHVRQFEIFIISCTVIEDGHCYGCRRFAESCN